MAAGKRIVTVTGATGFVGRCLVAQLLREDKYRVRCLVRRDIDLSKLRALSPDLDFHYGDITHTHTLVKAFEGAWGVVNLAESIAAIAETGELNR